MNVDAVFATVWPSQAGFGVGLPVLPGPVSGRNWSETSYGDHGFCAVPLRPTRLVSLMMPLAERTNVADALPPSNVFWAAGVAVIPVPPPPNAVAAVMSVASDATKSAIRFKRLPFLALSRKRSAHALSATVIGRSRRCD